MYSLLHEILEAVPKRMGVFSRLNEAFDETLKISSWEYVEQIPTVMVTFVQATFVFCDICPYQECPSSNWPNYDETLEVGFWEY